MNYDANKLPLGTYMPIRPDLARCSSTRLLGKLAKSTILNGFAALKVRGGALASVAAR